MTLTKEQIELLKATSLQDGRNAWEYIHLYEEGKQPWVAAGILSCIVQGLNLLPEIISTEAGYLKYGECKITELTEQQKRVCPIMGFKGICFLFTRNVVASYILHTIQKE